MLTMMVGDNLKDWQLQQLVDKTIIVLGKDRGGKISFQEFSAAVGSLESHKKLLTIVRAFIRAPPNNDFFFLLKDQLKRPSTRLSDLLGSISLCEATFSNTNLLPTSVLFILLGMP